MVHRIEKQFAGRTLVMETGRMARQAGGAVFLTYGDSAVLVTATAQRKRTHLPFFPLTVEYRAKSYAAGKFPGGFIKREGRPSDKETVSARQIDRPLRPLFPDDYRNETQIVCFVISADQENDADVLGMLGASTALMLSSIPWNGPVAGVRVGRVDGEWLINPTFSQLDYSDVDMVIAGTQESIVMVEGASVEVSEEDILEALEVGHKAIRELIDIQMELVALAGGKPDVFEFEIVEIDADFVTAVEAAATTPVSDAYRIDDKAERETALENIKADLQTTLGEEFPDDINHLSGVFKNIEKATMRRRVLDDGVRADGRGLNDVRDISCEVGLLPRAHGSALFTRGQTQALAVITLGSVRDEQRIDSIDTVDETSKSFMLHYNFPPFCVGEAKPFRGVSRREVGHGMLAERSLQPLLPAYEDFPYTIRVVSDILESNGSSSMASVCGGSLALMNAGVPMRSACAGIAMGLIKEGDDIAILTDILGVEDFLGDMDFKVAGTKEGITAIQMDIKINGLDIAILRDALERAREGRLHILDVMSGTLAEPAAEMSEWAPQIVSIKINTQKIGDLIGPKGKTIRAIQEETGATLNVEDDGTVTISAVGGDAGRRAREMVEAITAEPEIGRIYEGVIKNTTTFGAFVEILPGVEGLCHISELEEGRTEKTEDVVNTGDVVKVKLLAVDERGRMKLSIRAAIAEQGALAES
ncbi:MAG: polyribonucleotide nucleotidyltransferase [Gemmatimonadetes bacterium]|nr:MAG: polyribonucleotide nucleotidyltransferase [Gemmatimonadota bacterium]